MDPPSERVASEVSGAAEEQEQAKSLKSLGGKSLGGKSLRGKRVVVGREIDEGVEIIWTVAEETVVDLTKEEDDK